MIYGCVCLRTTIRYFENCWNRIQDAFTKITKSSYQKFMLTFLYKNFITKCQHSQDSKYDIYFLFDLKNHPMCKEM